MHIHREGFKLIGITIVFLTSILVLINIIFPEQFLLHYVIYFVSAIFLIWTISFFRVPHRSVNNLENSVVSSADGTVVVIEEVFEPEYFKDKRIQISVFMSPLNVHVNWFPFAGKISYVKYHPGKFLIANHPKSSIENERNTVVVKDEMGREVLLRQIAGMMARRIVCFVKPGNTGSRGDEFGLIRYGSRVDFFVPTTAEINVKIGDKVKGCKTVLAQFQK
ncbi:MAG: phosphatidylserine decarboxylase family protein [Ignavibacteria bacterium]|nr:phosphatidylserine decarboxylase family protein [Ignavibacteria bacterium]